MRRSYQKLHCSVRERRQADGLTLQQVADGADVSLTTIARMEIGGQVTLSNALRVARWFGLPVEELWKLRRASRGT